LGVGSRETEDSPKSGVGRPKLEDSPKTEEGWELGVGSPKTEDGSLETEVGRKRKRQFDDEKVKPSENFNLPVSFFPTFGLPSSDFPPFSLPSSFFRLPSSDF